MAYAQIIATECVSSAGLNKLDLFNSSIDGKIPELQKGLIPFTGEQWLNIKEKAPLNLQKSKCTVLSYNPLKSVIDSTQWTTDQLDKCGFIFATTTSEIDLWEEKIPFFENVIIDEYHKNIVRHQSLGLILEDLKKYFKINGPCSVVTSSCSASLQALSLAALWIQNKKVDRCIIASTEILSTLTSSGFESLRLLSKESCKPFDRLRNGINLGEASACIAIENLDLSTTKPLAYISGIGLSSDAHHATSPHPEGLGSERAIQQSLNSAQLNEKDISWFYAHGTGSLANDLAEAKAISKIFTHNQFVSSSKFIHGHTLAASGLLESVLAIEALKNQKVILNTLFKNADPAFEINLTRPPSKIKHILKNSLGFGGINCSVILSQERSS